MLNSKKFDEADSRIKTSQKRIATIEKRFLVIKNEIEQMNQDQGTVDSELEDVKESITKINKEKTTADKKIENVNSFTSIMIVLSIIIIPIIFVISQPDLGTSVLIALSGLIILWLGCVKIKYFIYSFVRLFLIC